MWNIKRNKTRFKKNKAPQYVSAVAPSLLLQLGTLWLYSIQKYFLQMDN